MCASVVEVRVGVLVSSVSAETLRVTSRTSSARRPATTLGRVLQLVTDDRAHRARNGRPTFGWGSLTATETKVAALVVEGLTNREIGEQLIMGRETAKSHVASILRKLGLSNRTQLAAAYSSSANGAA